jgi:hypothetical protein
VDPVSTAALGWLTEQAAATSVHGLKRLLVGDDLQNALRRVARAGLEAAILEVISPTECDVVLEAVLRYGPDESDVQVADAPDLPTAVITYLGPRFAALADQGYSVDTSRLAEVFAEKVMSGIRADEIRNGPLRPLAQLLRGERLLAFAESASRELTRANYGLDQISARVRQHQLDVAALFDQLGIARPGPLRENESRLARFTGRKWLIAEMDDFISSHSSGYVVVEGEAGIGKTTLALWLADARGYACHFTRQPGGRAASVAGKSLAAQLITLLGMQEDLAPGGVFPPGASEPQWLAQVITSAAARQRSTHPYVPLVLVVDGLDEAERADGPPLGLPAILPAGVFIITTMRTGTPVRWLREEHVTTCKLQSSSKANVDDVRSYLEEAVRQPGISAKLVALGLSEAWFTATLLDRCCGVWIYLRYVLEEIRSGELPPGRVDSLPRGLWAYYTENIGGLRGQSDLWDSFYLPLLATLSVAREPLTASALAAMAGMAGQPGAVRRFLTGQWRPFCTVAADDRYELYHQSLRDYLVGIDPVNAAMSPEFAVNDRLELSQAAGDAHQRLADRYLTAWGSLRDGLPTLASDLQAATLDDGYGLRHLPAHLEYVGSGEDVHRILACEQPAQAPSGMANSWYSAHDRAGTLDIYLDHVARAAALARRDVVEARVKSYQAPAIGLAIRYALIEASIASLAASLPPPLIARLVAEQIWQPEQALSQIRSNPDPASRCRAYIDLLPQLPDRQRSGVLAEALNAARTSTRGWLRARNLSGLIPHLPDSQRSGVLAEAVRAAQAASDDGDRASALRELAPQLSEGQRLAVLTEALDAAKADFDTSHGWEALCELAPVLPAKLLNVALDTARDAYESWFAAHALAALVPCLPESQRPAVLAEALEAIENTNNYAWIAEAVGKLVPHMPENKRVRVLAQALRSIRAMNDSGDKARALGVLAPHLPESERTQVLAEALEAARSGAEDDEDEAWALSDLAPRLPAHLLSRALMAAQDITDARCRADALGALAPHMPKAERHSVLAGALDAIKAISRGSDRGTPLEELTPHLPAKMLASALEAARAIGDDEFQAGALAALIPHLPESERSGVLAEVLRANVPRVLAQHLGAIAPHLSPVDLATALRGATLMRNDRFRAMALGALVSYLPETQRTSVLADALQEVWAHGLLSDSAGALAELVDKLRENEHATVMAQALKAVQASGETFGQEWMIAVVAPYLLPDLLTIWLKTARAIADPRHRAMALAVLAPHLPHSQRHGVLAESLRATETTPYGIGREGPLTSMAPCLPSGLVARALRIARAIGNDSDRAVALASLIPKVPESQRAKVLTQAWEAAWAANNSGRAAALAALAPHLPADMLASALEALAATDESYGREDALAALAPHLPASLLRPALHAARAITTEPSQGKAIGHVAQRLWSIDDTDRAELDEEMHIAVFFEGLSRAAAFALLEMMAGQIATLGDETTFIYIRTTISDVIRWWP